MNVAVNILHIEHDDQALHAAFPIMKELRPHLEDPAGFALQIRHQREQGYRLLAARRDQTIVGLAGYRLQDNLLYGRFVYVDDLVVSHTVQRSHIGGRLLAAVREQAIHLQCAHLVLDTGLHMALAQRFYFRQGLLARGMHFVEPLSRQRGASPLAAIELSPAHSHSRVSTA